MKHGLIEVTTKLIENRHKDVNEFTYYNSKVLD